MAGSFSIPSLPAKHTEFLEYIRSRPDTPIGELLKPYHEYDSVLRRIFAQEPLHPLLADNCVNAVSLYDANGASDLRVRARDLSSETNEVKEKYIMPLKDDQRRSTGSSAVIPTFNEFQKNFNVFTEGSLVDLDWSNVVAAGSAVVTPLLPVPEDYQGSKRALRQFYHQKCAPASDVDLFIYGLTEEQAIAKIKHIERTIKDSILQEVTTVRTKNTITIVSQYPTRHVQVVLRIYKSISEILTGFDVDCACAAYDGENVYVAPRAAASFITQINTIDLTRRSPSYENRLSKYFHRGFEVFWPQLDRSRIDPTIFERSFARVVGLARLLVLEQLPKPSDREEYLEQRRVERGRPPLNLFNRDLHKLYGNIKDEWEEEIAEWVEEDEISDYHTFTIPYGQRFNARKIERLVYTKDLLLNAEWNNKDREVNLHRHPAFIGNVEDVIHDCCGYCPKPVTPEEIEAWETESKKYISGDVSFMTDDAGRQTIGSFNPITETDWTEMAYVGNTARLCEAIVNRDLETVKEWLSRQDADPNCRDHTGRSPLHLAVMTSTPEVVQCLVDHGARLIARLADGQTALHLAAALGSVEMVRTLLNKSEENEEAEEEKKDQVRKDKMQVTEADMGDEDAEMVDSATEGDRMSIVSGSFVNVKREDDMEPMSDNLPEDEKGDKPDIYDINAVAWDNKTSPLHLAILHGHVAVVEELVSSFGADVLLPIKLTEGSHGHAPAAILTLVLSLRLPPAKAATMAEALLRLGATPAQADLEGKTPLHYLGGMPFPGFFEALLQHDKPGVKRAVNHLAIIGFSFSHSSATALNVALASKIDTHVTRLLEVGASTSIEFGDYLKAVKLRFGPEEIVSPANGEDKYACNVEQPIITAVKNDKPSLGLELLRFNANPNTLGPYNWREDKKTVLDIVAQKLRELQNYEGEIPRENRPVPLDQDDHAYLGPYSDGTYQFFMAKEGLKDARKEFDDENEAYGKALKEAEHGTGVAEKKSVIKALIRQFEELKKCLVENGAKSYVELHPDEKRRSSSDSTRKTSSSPKKPFKIRFEFGVSGLTDETKDGYLKLFEAAWTGDLDTIQSLTLGMWGPNTDKSPLEIGMTDSRGFSPFSIAVLRGNLNVAKAVLEIARSQYKPKKARGREEYNLETWDGESYCSSNSSTGDDEIPIRKDTIYDEYTIDNVGETVTQVESNITPLQIFSSHCQTSLFAESKMIPGDIMDHDWKPYSGKNSLLEFAILVDNIELLTYLLDLRRYLTSIDPKTDDSQPRRYSPPTSAFLLAVQFGRLRCLEALITQTGAGLPVEELLQQSGLEIKEKPKYYRGLSIHGKKRADWANAGRGDRELSPANTHLPLLEAAAAGSLVSVEWFLGMAPRRHYTDFAHANKQDTRLERLGQAEPGIDGTIMKWLTSRNDIVLHCATLSNQTDESEKLILYLAKNYPQLLEVKSATGYTPLALAFHGHKNRFAKILIEAGANQTFRDKNGNNLIHLLLCNIRGHPVPEPAGLKEMLELLDPRLVPSLLTERSSEEPGSLTPIARWLNYSYSWPTSRLTYTTRHSELETDDQVAVVRLILEFAAPTGQKHLELIDATGNTPVHNAVQFQLPRTLMLMLDHSPDSLRRENSTGCTPTELAANAWVAEATAESDIPGRHDVHERLRSRRGSLITERDPIHFLSSDGEEARTEKTKIYQLCLETEKELGETNRKLVSLFEANEVAKRLASRRYTQRNGNGSEKTEDEVSEWC